MYDHRNWWSKGQTVEFYAKAQGFPHEVIVRGELLGFIGGEFPGDGYPYAFVEVAGEHHYRVRADELLVKARS
jgi:hypothetical protein